MSLSISDSRGQDKLNIFNTQFKQSIMESTQRLDSDAVKTMLPKRNNNFDLLNIKSSFDDDTIDRNAMPSNAASFSRVSEPTKEPKASFKEIANAYKEVHVSMVQSSMDTITQSQIYAFPDLSQEMRQLEFDIEQLNSQISKGKQAIK